MDRLVKQSQKIRTILSPFIERANPSIGHEEKCNKHQCQRFVIDVESDRERVKQVLVNNMNVLVDFLEIHEINDTGIYRDIPFISPDYSVLYIQYRGRLLRFASKVDRDNQTVMCNLSLSYSR